MEGWSDGGLEGWRVERNQGVVGRVPHRPKPHLVWVPAQQHPTEFFWEVRSTGMVDHGIKTPSSTPPPLAEVWVPAQQHPTEFFHGCGNVAGPCQIGIAGVSILFEGAP
jgi:hypothetical protein